MWQGRTLCTTTLNRTRRGLVLRSPSGCCIGESVQEGGGRGWVGWCTVGGRQHVTGRVRYQSAPYTCAMGRGEGEPGQGGNPQSRGDQLLDCDVAFGLVVDAWLKARRGALVEHVSTAAFAASDPRCGAVGGELPAAVGRHKVGLFGEEMSGSDSISLWHLIAIPEDRGHVHQACTQL